MEVCKCNKEKEIATLISENKSMFKQFDNLQTEVKEMGKLQETIYEMVTSVTLLASQMTDIKDDVSSMKSDMKDVKKLANNMEEFNTLKEDVKTMKEQPAKDLFHYKKLIVGAVITAIVGAFITGKLL